MRKLKSFSKAAEQLHITHTAIIRQINNLEGDLEVRLFNRTFQGVSLTPAGESFYEDVLHILQFAEISTLRTRQIANKEQKKIYVGSSLLCPSEVFFSLWDEISIDHPEYNLVVVPYDDATEFSKLLNHSFDFIVGTYDDYYKEKYQVQVIPLGRYRYYVAVPKTHPLAQRTAISLKDLDHEHLLSVSLDVSENMNHIRKYLEINCPNLTIEKLPSESSIIHVANSVANSNSVMLTLECWRNIHPSLVYLPITEDFSFPYGIICSLKPRENMEHFLSLIKEHLAKKEG